MAGGTVGGGGGTAVQAKRRDSEGTGAEVGDACALHVHVCCSHVVREGAAKDRSRVQPAKLGRAIRHVEGEHVRRLGAMLGRQAILEDVGGAGLCGTALE